MAPQFHLGWTEERTALAVQLWRDGHSAAQIARQLGGTSRNAVIGKICRLGFMRTLPNVTKAARPAKAPKPITHRTKTAVAAVRRLPEPIEGGFDGRVAKSYQKPWTARETGECAFPVLGRGADIVSCCAPTTHGPYCPAHRWIMYDQRLRKPLRAEAAGKAA